MLFKSRFKRDYQALDPNLRAETDQALKDLLRDPLPPGRRFHSLKGFKNPKLYTFDVTANKAYKISLEIDGETAILRRIATHREIDRAA